MVGFLAGARDFSVLQNVQTSMQFVLRSFSPWIKQTGREAGHSPPSYAEVKNEWSYTLTSHMPLWH
jgi:hypothetical protein